MSRQQRPSGRRGRRPSPAVRYVLVFAAFLLVAGGFYLGYRSAQPPPPPDFEALRSEPADEAPRSRSDVDPPPGAPASDPADSREGATARASDADGKGFDADAPLELKRQPAPGNSESPLIALVIDDLGRSLGDLERLRSLGVPITYSVLPFEVLTPEVVEDLRQHGEEVLCHLPMEAVGGANPGPGALRVSMSDGELLAATRAALDAVPGAIGVNNHMGSAVMADRRALSQVLEVLEDRDLFFLDSRTSAETLGYSLARQRGLRTAERQVFLDPSQDRETILAQFQVLLQTARSRGAAIAIAHPYDQTLDILDTQVPEALKLGFRFVHASELADP